MGITRYKQFEDPALIVGKADFEWFYSGTLQTGDDNKIPVKTKSINVVVDRLDVVLYSASTGADVKVKFYKNGALIDMVTVLAGTLTGTTTIPDTVVTAGDKMTVSITQVGTGLYGVTMSAYARVST